MNQPEKERENDEEPRECDGHSKSFPFLVGLVKADEFLERFNDGQGDSNDKPEQKRASDNYNSVNGYEQDNKPNDNHSM